MQPTGTEPSEAAPAKNMGLGHFLISVVRTEKCILDLGHFSSCCLPQEKCGKESGQQTEAPRMKRV